MKYHRGWVGQAAGNLIRFEMSTGASTRKQFGLLSLPGLHAVRNFRPARF